LAVTIPVDPPADPVPRLASRVLLLDAADRLLMFRGFDPADPDRYYWFTAGGGLNDGETFVEGALRELREETGLSVTAADLVGPVWHQRVQFPFDGVWYRQEQEYFVVRVESWEVEVAGFDEDERRSIHSHRWWTVADMVASVADPKAEKIYPRELPDLVRAVLAGETFAPPAPVIGAS
jgi:8-oxo-dGTP pyrophosphatase MutT (NUDIX family)